MRQSRRVRRRIKPAGSPPGNPYDVFRVEDGWVMRCLHCPQTFGPDVTVEVVSLHARIFHPGRRAGVKMVQGGEERKE